MTASQRQAVYFVACFTTTFRSMEEVRAAAPEALARHLAQSKELQAKGDLLMAGAFLVAGALSAYEARRQPAERDPDPARSWMTLSSSYLRPDGHSKTIGLVVRAWANILD